MLKYIKRFFLKFRNLSYRILDFLYIPLDKQYIHRTRNIKLIPLEKYRKGGKYAYAEWAHVIGIFQTLINLKLRQKENNHILDVGCGTGLIGIACEPFLGEKGKYTGIDVIREQIAFCISHFPKDKFTFIHIEDSNPYYAPNQTISHTPWPIESSSMNLVTALSVWTHFNESDSSFYINEIARVLSPDGIAIISFFLLDEHYRKFVSRKQMLDSEFHSTNSEQWIFSQSAYGSNDWLHPIWALTPEEAIGITESGFNRLLSTSGMKVQDYYPGNWKEFPGLFFQDVIVFRKSP